MYRINKAFSVLTLLGFLFLLKPVVPVIGQSKALSTASIKGVWINGDTMHYIDIGKGEPILLVHGSLGDYRTWEAQLDVFAKDHRVIAYSRRYAYPNKQVINDSADYGVEAHSEDLSALVKGPRSSTRSSCWPFLRCIYRFAHCHETSGTASIAYAG